MSNCTRCGRELPAFSVGAASDVCADCRTAAAYNPEFASPTPQPSPTAVRRRRPPVTLALVGINTAVFVAMVLTGVSAVDPTNEQLLKWGADWGPLTLGGQPWRMLTSNYLHGGIIHILLNMWCLWNLGFLAELVFDRWTYILTYTACGIGGSLASLAWHPMVVGVGASGAIFGLAGALIAALYLGHLPIPPAALKGTLRSLLAFAGYNLFFGSVVARIDNSAHIGGLVTGLVIGALIAQRIHTAPEIRNRWRNAVFVGVALILLLAGGYVKRLRGDVIAIQSANDALQRGDYEKAIPSLQAVVTRNPKDKVSLMLLGAAYLQKKDYPHAEQVLKQSLALDPDNVATQYNLGLLYGAMGRHEEARQVFSKLAEQHDDDDVQALLGSALEGLNREPEAEAAYKRAIELNADNNDARRSLGIVQLKLGETDQAISTLNEVVKRDPKDAAAYIGLGRAYAAKHMAAEAEEAFAHARELSKEHP